MTRLRPAAFRQPQRDRLSWRSFLRAHADSILACGFFTVETARLLRLHGLVFFSIGLGPLITRMGRREEQAIWS